MQSEITESYVKIEGERIFAGDVRIELIKAVIEKGKPFRFTASGFSMSPFIRDQDIITIEPVSPGRPLCGDVAACELPTVGTLVIHRIVKRQDNAFLIKGDNRAEPDGIIRAPNILGIVTSVERNGKRITAGLGWGRGLIAFLSRAGLLQKLFLTIRLPGRITAAGLQKVQDLTGYPRNASRTQSGNRPLP